MPPPANTERYKNHRCPGAIIRHGVWLYYRFTLQTIRAFDESFSLNKLTKPLEGIPAGWRARAAAYGARE